MARLTFAQILTYGGLIGQNNAATTWQGVKLRAWLRKHYVSWAWPFLITQATGIALAAGNTSLLVGGGTGGLTPQISRIFSPVYYRANGYATRGKAPIRMIVGDDYLSAIGQVDPSATKGAPQSFIATPSIATDGKAKFTLIAYPVPDVAYTLAFTYQQLPDDPADTDVPSYPNEMTLIQAAKVAAIEYDQTGDPMYRQEADVLAQMVAADRAAYGGTPSFGDFMQLDSSVFLP